MYRLPDQLRPALREIIGELVDDRNVEQRIPVLLAKHDPVIAVGDMTSLRLLELGLLPAVCIIDGTTRRGDFKDADALTMHCTGNGYRTMVVDNPAATITDALEHAIVTALRSYHTKTIYTLIKVRGEEDLASLPCIIHANDGAAVVFGVPGTGMQVVTADRSTKTLITNLLQKMEATTNEH